VGDLAASQGLHKDLFMATKVWTTGRSTGIDQMESSFSKMQVKTMDLMQVHNLVDVYTHLDTLKRWKDEGKVRYIGITHYTASAFPKLIEVIKNSRPDFVQFNYNILDRVAEDRLLPTAKEFGVATIINRPFGEASLFSMVRGKSLPSWSGDFEIESWAQYFLKFIISHPDVTCAIPGTSKPHHMADNARAGYGSLPDSETRKKMVEYLQ
jgi:diketogulonate reductase-like aldo/keto reductase